MNSLFDLKQSLRILKRNRGVSLIATLTLAVGVGPLVGIFSFARTVLLEDLPLPDRLFAVAEKRPTGFSMTVPAVLPMLQEHSGFVTVGQDEVRVLTFRFGEGADRRTGQAVTQGFVQMLGFRPFLGRDFSPEEHRDLSQVLLLTHDCWVADFGGDPSIIGEPVSTDQGQFVVIGVLPQEFYFPQRNNPTPSFLTPSSIEAFMNGRSNRASPWVSLRPGVTWEAAQAELDTRFDDFFLPEQREEGRSLQLLQPMEMLFGSSKPFLLFLLAGGSVVLLLASANLVKLFLAQGQRRSRELAIRSALGAGRWALIRQLLFEGLLISLAGAALSLLLTSWLVGWLQTQPLQWLGASPDSPGLDGGVLAATLLASIAAGLVATVIPALRFSRVSLQHLPRASSWIQRRSWWKAHGFVVGEIAGATILLVMAGLTLLTMLDLKTSSLGFETSDVSVVYTSVPFERYSTGAQRAPYYQALLERIRTLPEVSSAAAGTITMFGATPEGGFELPDSQETGGVIQVTSGYFQTLGMRVLQGRGFNETESFSGALVAVVNEGTARILWPGENPIGRSWHFESLRGAGSDNESPRLIVGVVEDSRLDLRRAPVPAIYVPFDRNARRLSATIIVRAGADQSHLASTIRQMATSLEPWTVVTFESLNDALNRGVVREEFQMTLYALLATLAVLLSVVGLYGVVSFAVARRKYEFGVRLALGATAPGITRLVLRQTFIPLLVGFVLGGAAALLLENIIESTLFGIRLDVSSTIPAVAMVALAIGLAAGLPPARRASRVNPVEALAAE